MSLTSKQKKWVASADLTYAKAFLVKGAPGYVESVTFGCGDLRFQPTIRGVALPERFATSAEALKYATETIKRWTSEKLPKIDEVALGLVGPGYLIMEEATKAQIHISHVIHLGSLMSGNFDASDTVAGWQDLLDQLSEHYELVEDVAKELGIPADLGEKELFDLLEFFKSSGIYGVLVEVTSNDYNGNSWDVSKNDCRWFYGETLEEAWKKATKVFLPKRVAKR